MRSYVASAILAGAVVLAPAVAGYTPALSQDFSITNPGSGTGSDWTRKLQAWWDLHAYYPPDALENRKDGTVKVHLIIQPNGEVWKSEVVQGSGVRSLDMAGYEVFKNGHLPPFPPGAPAPPAEVNLALHYVLAPRLSKSAFTVGTDPVHDTVVDTMMTRTCTGIVVPIWWAHLPDLPVQAVFYRRPDGTKWVKFYYNGNGPDDFPITELGVSAQWNSYGIAPGPGRTMARPHYAVWPDGDNHLSGQTAGPWGRINLTCEWQPTWSGFNPVSLR